MTRQVLMATVTVLIIACSGKETSGQRNEDDSKKPVTSQNDLPAMEITQLDGTKMDARSLEGKTVLVMFFPDCDHCQVEARAMQQNLDAFRNYTIFYLSSASKEEIEEFGSEYELSKEPNVRFGMVSSESVINNFGSIPTPSVYLYDETGSLIQSFIGQTDISVIKKYL